MSTLSEDDAVIKALTAGGVYNSIVACLTVEHSAEITEIWRQLRTVTWFEAFAIWLLRRSGFEVSKNEEAAE